MNRALLTALVALSLACRNDPAPQTRARRIPRAPAAAMPPPPVDPVPPAPSLAMIPGHGAEPPPPPAPDPASGPLVGWDLVPFEDGLGRDGAVFLVLTERVPGSPPRDLLHAGVRRECREVAPPMLRVTGDGGAGLVGAMRTVRCALPEPASFSLVRDGDQWAVVRAGCERPSRVCGAVTAPDVIVARVPIETPRVARTPGGLMEREAPRSLPPPTLQDARMVRARWSLDEPVLDGAPTPARMATLTFEGAVHRRIEFGAATALRVDTGAPLPGVRNAIARVVIETVDEGPRAVALTRDGDVVRVHAAGESSTIITQRVALPPRAPLTLVPPAP